MMHTVDKLPRVRAIKFITDQSCQMTQIYNQSVDTHKLINIKEIPT